MHLSTENLQKSLTTLECSLQRLQFSKPDSIDYEIFRNAAIKGFELTLETAGKLLRKALKFYTSNPREVDAFIFKDVLRHAAKHGLLETAAIVRWFAYRDNRNNTAHDYGKMFAEKTLTLLPDFINDVRALEQMLTARLGQRDA